MDPPGRPLYRIGSHGVGGHKGDHPVEEGRHTGGRVHTVEGVQCSYVPGHYVPDCLKHPLITTSITSLPVIMTYLLKYLIWSLRPLYVMSLVGNVSLGAYDFCVMSHDHNVSWTQHPWSQHPLITMSLWSPYPWSIWAFVYLIIKNFYRTSPTNAWAVIGCDWPTINKPSRLFNCKM